MFRGVVDWLSRRGQPKDRKCTHRRLRRDRFCQSLRQLQMEPLEARVMLARESVFPTGLDHPDPTTRTLIQNITTTASDAPIYVADVPVVSGDFTPSTQESGPLIGMPTFQADGRFASVDGSGFAAVILDTGIDLNHPFFGADTNSDGVADRIVYHWDFADNNADASDLHGHGSNVSSIIASEDMTWTGMAPSADIIHLKVFRTSDGAGQFSYIENALQWVVANAADYSIASVNMSLGDNQNFSTSQTLYGIDDELAALAAMDVIVVSASGNGFYGFDSEQGVAYPAPIPIRFPSARCTTRTRAVGRMAATQSHIARPPTASRPSRSAIAR